MHRHPLELAVHHQPEEQTQRADGQAPQEKRAPVNPAQEADLREVRDDEIGFSAGMLHLDGTRGSCGGSGDRAVGAVFGHTLRASDARENRGQRENESKRTNYSCELPIHSDFSKGE